jgi:hypothetical protein
VVPEASVERTEHGALPVSDGWFVVNLRDARALMFEEMAGEQASGTAHAGAARGHLFVAQERVDAQAREHRMHALLPGDEGFR